MTTTRKVRLEGGPCHNDVIEVEAWRRAKTVFWTELVCRRNWGDDLTPNWITVEVREQATYRATDDPGVFEHVPETPTAIGDMERLMRGEP